MTTWPPRQQESSQSQKTVNDSMYLKCPRQAFYRQQVSGVGGWHSESHRGVRTTGKGKCRSAECGADCRHLWIHWKPLNHTTQSGNMVCESQLNFKATIKKKQKQGHTGSKSWRWNSKLRLTSKPTLFPPLSVCQTKARTKILISGLHVSVWQMSNYGCLTVTQQRVKQIAIFEIKIQNWVLEIS